MIDVQVFAGTRMEIYQPKIASAEELALEMTKVMQSFAASAPQADSFTAQFIALPRINQLLVISHSETAWTYAKRWLDRIDVVAEGPGRRIFIYPVENGKATELADVLNQALGQAAAATRSSAPTLQSLHRASPTGMSQQNGIGYPPSSFGPSSSGFSNPQRGATGSSFGSAFATVPVPGQVTPPVATPQPQATPVAPGAPRSAAQGGPTQTPPPEQLRIVPDPATNSLIIYGTAQEFQNIKNILKDLDAIPRQVLIEALILQVDLKDTEDFGVDYQILTKSRQTIFGQTFGSNAAITTLGKLLPAAPIFSGVSGLSAIVGDDTVSALIRAAATDSRIKLLSSPSVLASDNRPARIQVGSEEPIPTGTVQSPASSGTITSSTTIQYRNTGRILTIIPQVNSQGLVNLQIKAEVSARGDNITVGQDSFPVFNTQDAETSAVVHDGETLVIGGLIGERKSRGRSGVPYLMDIPVIGRFFGSTSDSNERTELIMLITPRVVRNRDESRFATAEFKSKLSAVRNELERMAREREKSQPLPRPEDLPPMPVPPANDQSPNAAPSQTPPGRGASAAPPAGSAAAQPNGTPGKAGNEVPTAARQSIATPPRLNRPIDSFPMQPGGGQVDQEQHSPPPAYALSIVKENLEKPTETVTKPIEAASKTTTTRIWTVQVAAVNLIKDAEGLAGQLRREGYDAYVVTAQIDSKTWHRVRVGQLPRLKEAVELKKVLASSTQFKGSYVAAR
jgi:general secretion pathway protein D